MVPDERCLKSAGAEGGGMWTHICRGAGSVGTAAMPMQWGLVGSVY